MQSRSSRPRADYTEETMTGEGHRDGCCELPIPGPADDRLPAAVRQVIHASEAELHREAASFRIRDGRLKAQWQTAYTRTLHAAASVLSVAEAVEAHERLHAARMEEHAPASDGRFGKYYAVMFGVGLGDVCMNEVCFRLMQAAEIETAGFALLLSGVLVWSAHWSGAMLREGKRGPACGLSALALGVDAFVAGCRALHISSLDPKALAPAGPQAAFWLTWLGFFLINALVLCAGLAASYHVGDRLLEQIFRERAALARALGRFEAAHAGLVQAFEERVSEHQCFLAGVEASRANVRRLIECYVAANLRARQDRASGLPLCLRNIAVPAIPEALTVLSWDAPPAVRLTIADLLKRKEIANVLCTDAPEFAGTLAYRSNGHRAAA